MVLHYSKKRCSKFFFMHFLLNFISITESNCDDGRNKAADVDTIVLVCSDTVATSTLQLNETNECNNAKLCAGDVCKESDAPAASIVESEDKEECYGVFKLVATFLSWKN